ncbi:hypothetical protein [Allopontixanthobacter sp.]|uniref:hypothetical protein n=1 Tax=Allopontixanthobacter sp. TaxID=2906452 RepID=UPI002AB8AF3E|nr:hypothetical protein [Allopontixanthobacter sp.]MDZ4307254.1 hypothetical protein [Allopontixanthobacter sp.]
MKNSVFLRLTLPPALALALAGCGDAVDPGPAAETDGAEVVAMTNYEPALVELPKAFSSPDCAVVAGAYAQALAEKRFPVAAQAWAEPVGTDKLALGYEKYGKPALQIGQAREEGAAGSLFCEVTVTLRDSDNPQSPLKQGTISFRRANNVPGATPDQLRWRIVGSTIDQELTGAAKTPPG